MSMPTYVEPDGGARHEMIDGTHVVKAGPDATGGAYEVFEVLAPRAPAAPPHSSPWTATLHLLEGQVQVRTADGVIDLAPGSTWTVPGGTPYTFEVLSDGARFVGVTSGDRAGRFFADLAASVPKDAPMEEAIPLLMAVTGRHGVSVG